MNRPRLRQPPLFSLPGAMAKREQQGDLVDDVQRTVVTDAEAPLVFIALQLFVSGGPWSVCQPFESIR